jgi:hypothetical protein
MYSKFLIQKIDKMRNKLLVFLPMIVGLVLMSCKKDEDQKSDISGTYTRTQVEATYDFQVKLTFSSNGTFTWEPIGTVEGHTASGASYELLSDTQLRIFNDSDCDSEGVYAYELANNKLTLTHITDACTPRIKGMEGEWQKE